MVEEGRAGYSLIRKARHASTNSRQSAFEHKHKLTFDRELGRLGYNGKSASIEVEWAKHLIL